MADKRLGKTDTGRKRLRRMGADADDDPDWQTDEQSSEVRKRQREEVRSAAEAEVEVKLRSFSAAHDTLLGESDEDEVREDVRQFGRLIVAVHARLSTKREKGQLDEQGEQVMSDIEKLFVVLQET